MEKGIKVKMSEKLKEKFILNNCKDHVEEFGNCIGITEDLVDYGDSKGPEIDVRWQPSNLRYCYLPEELEIMD